MNSLIILVSYHHKNTEKIAQQIAKILGSEIKSPEQIDPNSMQASDLIGFGSGVYFGKLDKKLLELADKLPQLTGKKAFVFSTSGRTGKGALKFHQSIKEKLQAKGLTITGEFNCGGFDTYGIFKISGGKNKGRPNADDLKQAETFAQNIAKNEPSTIYVE